MKQMTAQQAAEAAKGLTFETVWAAMMKTDARIEESQKKTDARIEESQKQTDARIEESRKQTDARMEESRIRVEETWKRIEESQKKTDKNLADLSKNLGGLGNSLGRLTEAIFTAELWKKFSDIGYPVSQQCNNKKFYEDNQVLTEVELLIENGEYAILVEIKTDLTASNVDDHLERIGIVRKYFDVRGDKRKLIGAVAGGAVPDNVMKYAHRKGLYVVTQTGDAVALAEMPHGFKAAEW